MKVCPSFYCIHGTREGRDVNDLSLGCAFLH